LAGGGIRGERYRVSAHRQDRGGDLSPHLLRWRDCENAADKSSDNVVADITRIVKDYPMDCVIFPGHMGHKDMAASASVMRDVCRDLGVPLIHIGLDVADRRYSTVDEIKDKLLRFFTTMGLV
jgi:hypothetical protein